MARSRYHACPLGTLTRPYSNSLVHSQPQLVLVPGEDLTPYRKKSAEAFSVLCEFGSATQKLGMDEVTTVCPKFRGTNMLDAVAAR